MEEKKLKVQNFFLGGITSSLLESGAWASLGVLNLDTCPKVGTNMLRYVERKEVILPRMKMITSRKEQGILLLRRAEIPPLGDQQDVVTKKPQWVELDLEGTG